MMMLNDYYGDDMMIVMIMMMIMTMIQLPGVAAEHGHRQQVPHGHQQQRQHLYLLLGRQEIQGGPHLNSVKEGGGLSGQCV